MCKKSSNRRKMDKKMRKKWPKMISPIACIELHLATFQHFNIFPSASQADLPPLSLSALVIDQSNVINTLLSQLHKAIGSLVTANQCVEKLTGQAAQRPFVPRQTSRCESDGGLPPSSALATPVPPLWAIQIPSLNCLPTIS